jgi:carboxymethylenebutenolidase
METPVTRYEGLIAETTRHSGTNDDLIEAYLARPLGKGPYPGVVVVHHMPGWDPSTKEFTRRLAYEGYVAICPNLYCREAPDASPDDAGAKVRAEGGVSDEQVVGDIGGAVRFLRALPYSNGRVGLIGFCSGGRQVYLAACRLDVDAAVDAHGGRVIMAPEELTERQPVAPIDLTKDMKAPLLGLFGDDDQYPTPEEVGKTRAELERYKKTFEFHSYPGAGHEFMNPHRPSYRVEAAVDAWEKLLAFYAKYLG